MIRASKFHYCIPIMSFYYCPCMYNIGNFFIQKLKFKIYIIYRDKCFITTFPSYLNLSIINLTRMKYSTHNAHINPRLFININILKHIILMILTFCQTLNQH